MYVGISQQLNSCFSCFKRSSFQYAVRIGQWKKTNIFTDMFSFHWIPIVPLCPTGRVISLNKPFLCDLPAACAQIYSFTEFYWVTVGMWFNFGFAILSWWESVILLYHTQFHTQWQIVIKTLRSCDAYIRQWMVIVDSCNDISPVQC